MELINQPIWIMVQSIVADHLEDHFTKNYLIANQILNRPAIDHGTLISDQINQRFHDCWLDPLHDHGHPRERESMVVFPRRDNHRTLNSDLINQRFNDCWLDSLHWSWTSEREREYEGISSTRQLTLDPSWLQHGNGDGYSELRGSSILYKNVGKSSFMDLGRQIFLVLGCVLFFCASCTLLR